MEYETYNQYEERWKIEMEKMRLQQMLKALENDREERRIVERKTNRDVEVKN